MSFIAKHITHQNERLLYLTRLNWVILLSGFFWVVLLGALGVFINWLILYKFNVLPSSTVPNLPYPYSMVMDIAAGLFPALMGLIIFLVYLFKFMGTEIALTDKRLIFKTGLFFVQSSEVEIAEISEATVDNGWFGVIFGYGTIHFDCRFVGDFTIYTVNNPYRIIRQINKLKSGGHPSTSEILNAKI